MMKRLVVLTGMLLVLSGVFFTAIEKIYEKRDEEIILKLKGEQYSNQLLNQQLELTSNTITDFQNGDISKEALNNSLNSLNNTYEFFMLSYTILELRDSSRFTKVHNLYEDYYLLSNKDTVTKEELKKILKSFQSVEQEVVRDIKSHEDKIRSYWWKNI
jgi:hypothetical protein